jgi:type IV pilus assembly protein PilE
MNNSKGFSLIELMIVVVVVGIIAAVAIPQYSQYVVRGNRAAAQSFMLDVSNREKQYLLDARSYVDSLATLGMTPPVDVSRNYTITISAPAGTPPTYTITATPVAGSKQENDGNLTLDDTGAKTHGAATTW